MQPDERLGLPSASSFWLDISCPGRNQLLRQLRASGQLDDQPNEYAERGRRIHKAHETNATLDLPDEDYELYKQGLVNEANILTEWKKEIGFKEVTEGAREERFWLHHPATLTPLISGQLDRYYLAGDDALITDLKSLWAPDVPPASRNWQLRVQALLLFRNSDNIKRVRVAINRAMNDRLDYADLTTHDLLQIERTVHQACWVADQPDSPRFPGAHCGKCAARGLCPQAASYATLPALTTPVDSEKLVQIMDAAALAKIFKASSKVMAILDGVTARIKAMSDEELAAVGLKRKPGRKLDDFGDTEATFNRLKELGMRPEDLLATMGFTKGALIKRLRVEHKLTSDKAAHAWIEEHLADYIVRKKAQDSVEAIE